MFIMLTSAVVRLFSSGVFSRRFCAARIRLSHSSTKPKMLFSYSLLIDCTKKSFFFAFSIHSVSFNMFWGHAEGKGKIDWRSWGETMSVLSSGLSLWLRFRAASYSPFNFWECVLAQAPKSIFFRSEGTIQSEPDGRLKNLREKIEKGTERYW